MGDHRLNSRPPDKTSPPNAKDSSDSASTPIRSTLTKASPAPTGPAPGSAKPSPRCGLETPWSSRNWTASPGRYPMHGTSLRNSRPRESRSVSGAVSTIPTTQSACYSSTSWGWWPSLKPTSSEPALVREWRSQVKRSAPWEAAQAFPFKAEAPPRHPQGRDSHSGRVGGAFRCIQGDHLPRAAAVTF